MPKKRSNAEGSLDEVQPKEMLSFSTESMDATLKKARTEIIQKEEIDASTKGNRMIGRLHFSLLLAFSARANPCSILKNRHQPILLVAVLWYYSSSRINLQAGG